MHATSELPRELPEAGAVRACRHHTRRMPATTKRHTHAALVRRDDPRRDSIYHLYSLAMWRVW
jgi:hypothetical protein